MARSTTYLNPALGRLPGVVPLALRYDFLCALPGPRVGGAVDWGRLMIQDALAVVDAAGPRGGWGIGGNTPCTVRGDGRGAIGP